MENFTINRNTEHVTTPPWHPSTNNVKTVIKPLGKAIKTVWKTFIQGWGLWKNGTQRQFNRIMYILKLWLNQSEKIYLCEHNFILSIF